MVTKMKNKHGVEGEEVWDIYCSPPLLFIPNICCKCTNFDTEWSEVSMGETHYCEKNIWFPSKKGTCKKYNGYLSKSSNSKTEHQRGKEK